MNYSNIDARLSKRVVFTAEQMEDLRRRIQRRLRKTNLPVHITGEARQSPENKIQN